jgi:hypothetical protein
MDESRQTLVCVECGATSAGEAEGWRAYPDVDGEAITFCPECAEREFESALSRIDAGARSSRAVLRAVAVLKRRRDAFSP